MSTHHDKTVLAVWWLCGVRVARLEAGVSAARLWLQRLLGLLLLQADLLRIGVFQGFDKHGGSGAGLPDDAIGVSHRGLHGDAVCPEDSEVQQELGAEVVVVRLHPLLHLIGHAVERNLEDSIVSTAEPYAGLSRAKSRLGSGRPAHQDELRGLLFPWPQPRPLERWGPLDSHSLGLT